MSQRSALGVLFLVLAAALVSLAIYAVTDRQWVIAFAAGVIGLWLATMAARALAR